MDKMSIEELLEVNFNSVETGIPNTVISMKTHEESEEPSLYVRETVTELNASYILEGSYMSLPRLLAIIPDLKELSPVSLKELFKDVNKILEDVRSLPPYEVQFRESKTFDPRFIAACNSIMDVSDKRSITAKLKEIGITTTRWNNFLKNKKNREYYEKLVDNIMDYETYQESRLAIARNVAQGDLPSIKYFHELTKKFTPKGDFDPQVIVMIMASMLDIVTKYVDGNVARKIADELETVAIAQLGPGAK